MAIFSTVRGGILEGLMGGVVFGMMMQMMTAPAPGGTRMPIMAMIAQIVQSNSVMTVWLYHLFNSAVIGGIFGWLLGTWAQGYGTGLGLGAAYGFAWWILGGLILMPLFLGMPAFTPLMMPEMRMVAMGSLVGHLIYGVVLGETFVMLQHRGSRSRTV